MKNVAYGLGILLVALLLYVALFTESQQPPLGLSKGQPAPDFRLKTLDGKEIALSDYRGKIVLINFWATWCPPCKEEMPLFESVYRKYKDRGFEILAISTDGNLEPVKKFVKEFGLTFPILHDDRNVANLYGVQGLPTSFLIDRDGKIVKVRLGKYKEIERDVKELL